MSLASEGVRLSPFVLFIILCPLDLMKILVLLASDLKLIVLTPQVSVHYVPFQNCLAALCQLVVLAILQLSLFCL